jgi:anti-sigma regulatory factor (Ser/Thr protein kinase)
MTDDRLVLVLPAEIKYLGLVGAFVQELCGTVPRMPPSASYNVELALNEALVNVIDHAYHDDPTGRIELSFRIAPDELEIQVRDWGESFDPASVADPDLDEPHESGYGVYLIRQLVDRASYQPNTLDGNLVTLVKNIP